MTIRKQTSGRGGVSKINKKIAFNQPLTTGLQIE